MLLFLLYSQSSPSAYTSYISTTRFRIDFNNGLLIEVQDSHVSLKLRLYSRLLHRVYRFFSSDSDWYVLTR
jgi:hypothetical protein